LIGPSWAESHDGELQLDPAISFAVPRWPLSSAVACFLRRSSGVICMPGRPDGLGVLPEQGLDANAVYSLGSSDSETARLQRQAGELGPDNRALLDGAGLRPGQSVIDLGCGPRGILDLLAERVSPGGRVVGVDADPALAAMAAGFAAARGLAGVEVMTADARQTGLPSGSFDLVHTRTLLVNVPEPARVVAEMTRLARPGGVARYGA
jgi:SAM-dependent methyltransferase